MEETELPDPVKAPAGELVWIAGGEIDHVSVSIRFYGDDLAPEQVTKQLLCQPTVSYCKGDVLPSRRYRRIAKTGSWLLQTSKDETGTLEEKISRLLDCVSDDPAVWLDLKRFQPDIFCGLRLLEWNRGCSLSPELMRRLAERDLTLGLDIYYYNEQDEQMPD